MSIRREITEYDHFMKVYQRARKELIKLKGVVGVGHGFKEKKGKSTGEYAIILYVLRKLPREKVDRGDLVPEEFEGFRTDVVELGKRKEEAQDSHDMAFMDPIKMAEETEGLRPSKGSREPKDPDIGNIAVVVDDGTLTFPATNVINPIRAYQLFRKDHSDVYDFVTFFVDTASGLADQGSYHSGVYNATAGINYYAGGSPASPFNKRASFGTNKLLAYHFIHTAHSRSNGAMLQEMGHMWAAFVHFKHYQGEAANHLDLLLGPTGQGLFHWGKLYDNDHSPMDYDGTDWKEQTPGYFTSHLIDDGDFEFCGLDLYLMGLAPSEEVSPFRILRDPHYVGKAFYGGQQELTVQNVVWAHGPRDPPYGNAQKIFKQAFVLLTKRTLPSPQVNDLVRGLEDTRREYTWQFYKATSFKGKTDTTITSDLRRCVIP